MKISKVAISNVKNFKTPIDVELSSYNVFIGKNGSGKSNLAKSMYDVASRALNRGLPSVIPFRGNYSQQSSIELTILLDKYDLNDFKQSESYSHNQHFVDNPKYREVLSLFDDTHLTLLTSHGSDGAKYQILEITPSPGDAGFQNFVSNLYLPLSIELRKRVLFVPDTRDLPPSFTFQNNFINEPINISNFMTFLTALKLDRRQRSTYDEIVELSKRLVPSIEDLVINPAGNNVSLGEEGSSYEIPAQEISKGTREILVLLAILVLAKEGSVVFIEEPEIHLHPAAVTELRKILREQIANKNLQVIFTTHSARFLDLVSPDDPNSKVIKFIREEGGNTSIHPVTNLSELTDSMDELERKD